MGKSREQIHQEAEKLRESNPDIHIRDEKQLTFLTDDQRHARELFVNQGITTRKEIAKRVDVHPSTVSRWITDYGWEEQRDRAQRSPERIAAKLWDILDIELTRLDHKPGGIDSKDVDRLVKLVSSIQKMTPNKQMYGSILTAINELLEFLAVADPDLHQSLLPYVGPFGQAMAEKYEY